MLKKEIVTDKIEVLEDGTIQTREVTRIVEDGVIISQKITNRKVIAPDQDMSDEKEEVQNIAKIVHTEARLKKYQDKKINIEKRIRKNA